MPHQCSLMAKLMPSQLPPLLPSPRKPASPPQGSPAFSLSRSPEVPQIFSPCGPPHQCSSVVELPPSRLPPLLPSPRAPASPQRRSLVCSLPRSPEVPCLPLLFPALRAGASRESASCLPAGGPPFEVAVVAHSCSTVAPVVLAFGVPAPPVSSFPSISFMLLFTLVTGPPMPPLTPRTSSFTHLLSVSSISFDSSFCTDLPSLHIQLPRLSRGSPHHPVSLPLPPVSHVLPHIPCVDSFSPALGSDLASASTPRPPLLSCLVPPPDQLFVTLCSIGLPLQPGQVAAGIAYDWCFRNLHPPSWCCQGGQTYVASRGFSMRVACWNVRGLSARYRRRYLSSWVRQNGPSVLIVVETKMSVVSHACVRTLMRQPSFGFLPANGTAGGILLAWSPPLTGAVVHIGRYSISASLSGFWPNGPVLVTAVYGPCVGALRGQLWAELHQVRQLAASPWLLARDFNCLLSPADSSSPVSFGQSMSAFRSFVDEFGLFDVPSTNGTFTWSNNRNPSILRRLDRIFLSPELFSAFPSSSLDLGPRHLSDHAPLLLSLHRGRAGSGPARFRFELWWLRDESFVATVPIWWARAVNGRWAAFITEVALHKEGDPRLEAHLLEQQIL
ncbi:hypothetical protein EJ110_NYTH13886 [Nymphaea thermarum]|nr:hypothetical protein EJ110_NYTH13886 [Nymphaea thermarum]